jgi:hypothetical protein
MSSDGSPTVFQVVNDKCVAAAALIDDGRTLAIDGWTDSAHWDPKRHRTFFIGMRKYKKFISYNVLTNAWQELCWAGDPPPKLEKFGHVYGRTALD